jgi:hypothetical protein
MPVESIAIDPLARGGLLGRDEVATTEEDADPVSFRSASQQDTTAFDSADWSTLLSKNHYVPDHHIARHDCSHDNGPLPGDVDEALDGHVDVAGHAPTIGGRLS